MDYLNLPMQIKAADSGRFSGYASIASTEDRQGDIVAPFAFKQFERNDDGKIVVLWQHDTRSPIGVASVEQDAKGLSFDGSLVLADPLAQRAQAHMKAGSVRGMSIGFDVNKNGSRIRDDGIRELTDLKLWEISLVTFPAHPDARITSVKSRADLEHVAREVLGLSKSKARRLAYAGWLAIGGDDPEPEPPALLEDERTRAARGEVLQMYLERGYAPAAAAYLSHLNWPEVALDKEVSQAEAAEKDFFLHLTNTLRGMNL